MSHSLLHRPLQALFLLASLLAPLSGPRAAEQPPQGQRIFICGHSFHVPIVKPLQEVAESAGIADQAIVGSQFLGGSQVIKHWNQPDERDQVKKALRTGGVDVLTLSPKGQFPDDGIENFADLALEFNPQVRVYVQQSWASFDSPERKTRDFKNEDRDMTNVTELRKVHEPVFQQLSDLVRELDDRLQKIQKRQVVYLVPAGSAVLTLREQVSQGKVPGIARQSELFRDPTGHGKGAVTTLTTYCYYAAVYGRNPVGLPVPSALHGQVSADDEEPLNQLLQQIAWDAVTQEPLSGVKQ